MTAVIIFVVGVVTGVLICFVRELVWLWRVERASGDPAAIRRLIDRRWRR